MSCVPSLHGTLSKPTDPPGVVEYTGGASLALAEAAAYDKNGQLVFSRILQVPESSVSAEPGLNPTARIEVSWYDMLEGLVPYNGALNWQGVSDGTAIVRPFLQIFYNDPLRARVGNGAMTTSFDGNFQNPADPIVPIKAFWHDENNMLIVELETPPTAGQIVTIQAENYPSGTASFGGLCRIVPPEPKIIISSSGVAVFPPGMSGTGSDSSGFPEGTYRFSYVSGAFFDGANYFCLNKDNTTRIRCRTASGQTWSPSNPPVPNVNWTAMAAGIDLAASAAAASALALAAPPLDVVLASTTRMAAGLLVPAGITGSVTLKFEQLLP
jgi:hypothetical protein